MSSSSLTSTQLQSAVQMIGQSKSASMGSVSAADFAGTPTATNSFTDIRVSYLNGSYISITGSGFYTGSRSMTITGMEVYGAGSGTTASMQCNASSTTNGILTTISGTISSLAYETPYAGMYVDYGGIYFSTTASSSGALSGMPLPTTSAIKSITAWSSPAGGGRSSATESLTLYGNLQFGGGTYSGSVTSLHLVKDGQVYDFSGFSLPTSTFMNGGGDASFYAAILGPTSEDSAGSGNDVLSDLPGDNKFDGGAGVDTVAFSGRKANHTITKTASGYTVTDNFGTGGTNTVTNVERLKFDDAKIALDVAGNSNAGLDVAGHANAGQVYRLYQAAFNRSPDKAGLSYWIGQADGNTPLTSIAGGFTGSAEFKSTYGSMTDHQFVDRLYQNVLHRGGDAGGLAYWYGQLDSRAQTREQILVGFAESNENQQALIGVIENGIDYSA